MIFSNAILKSMRFVETKEFTKKWYELGFSDNDLYILQEVIIKNPNILVIMQGTGGIRKMRFSLLNNKGKSSGVRVCYIYYDSTQTTILISVFSKNIKANLSKAERNALRLMEHVLQDMYGG